MKLAGKNHPWKRIFVGRDEIRGEESSIGRDFLLTGMKSAGKNHPWKRFFVGRDKISGEESSLEEDFYPQG